MRYRAVTVGAAVLLTLAVCLSGDAQQKKPVVGGKPEEAALVNRGEYLVSEVAHCSHCHTPQGGKGEPVFSQLLQGATLPIMPKNKTTEWADTSPDITRSGLAGKWSEKDMIKFLTTGVNPEGKKPIPPMPVFHLHPDDAHAVTLYLRSLPGKKG